MESKKGKEILEWLICILIALVVVAIIKSFIGFPTIVSGRSMDSTFKDGQRLWISRIGTEINKYPKKGDVITFEAPTEPYQTKAVANPSNPVAIYNEIPKNIFQHVVSAVSIFGETSYIKRVIGLPGDHIEIKDNSVYVNGEKLNEPYLDPGTKTTDVGGCFTDIVVPDKYIYVLGDNREDSGDSRRFGCIPIDKIEGRAVWRFWPLNQWKVIKQLN